MSRDVWLTVTALVIWGATIMGERLSGLGHLRGPLLPLTLILIVVMCAARLSGRVSIMILLIGLGAVGGSWAWNNSPSIVDGPCEGVATLRSDPTRIGHGTIVVLEMNSVRLKAMGFGRPSWRLESRLAGERVWVKGQCGPLRGTFARRDRVAHIVGRFSVDVVSEKFDEGSAITRSVNRVRRAMEDGVADIPGGLRALFTGLVIGDDRNQSRSMVNDFRASGLSHLCAVSGQNVSYLLAVASPLFRHTRRMHRWWLTMALLGWFVVLTRAEPSVLRAAFMGAAVATSGVMGVRLNPRSILAVTVIGLLLIDPMLAWSVGFALSVGATAGLAWLSTGMGQIVGGQGVIAATLAAQLGTMPVSLWVFGSVPVVSLVANPLTVATAGVVMTVGLPCALAAGMHPMATRIVSLVLSVPVGWIAGVAHIAGVNGPRGVTNVVCWCVVFLWLINRWVRQHRSTTDVAG